MSKKMLLYFFFSLIIVLLIRDFVFVMGKKNDKDELLSLFNQVKRRKISNCMTFVSPDSSRSFFHKCQFGAAPIVLSKIDSNFMFRCNVLKVSDKVNYSNVKVSEWIVFEDSSSEFRVVITARRI